jgi:hypothetical protein
MEVIGTLVTHDTSIDQELEHVFTSYNTFVLVAPKQLLQCAGYLSVVDHIGHTNNYVVALTGDIHVRPILRTSTPHEYTCFFPRNLIVGAQNLLQVTEAAEIFYVVELVPLRVLRIHDSLVEEDDVTDKNAACAVDEVHAAQKST